MRKLLPLVIPALCGCSPMAAALFSEDMSFFRAKVHGQIVAHAPSGEEQTIAFDDCMSGEPEGFFGVELVSSSTPAALRIAQDPIEGTRGLLIRPRSVVPLTAPSCAEAIVNKTGTRINGTTLLEGKVVVDCRADDGTTYAGTIDFSSCHRSAHALQVMNAAGTWVTGASDALAGAVRLPDRTPLARLPDPVSRLTVRLLSGAVGSNPTRDRAGECLARSRDFFGRIGWQTVDGDGADLDVETSCTGHVTLIEAPEVLGIVLPVSDGPSMTLRAGGQLIETIPPGPRALRCDMPKSSDRTARCAARAEAWSEARIEGSLAVSPALAAFAKSRHP